METYTGRTSRGIRAATLDEYRRTLRRDALPFFGTMRLAEIEPRDVKRYAAHIAARGVSRNTVRLTVMPVKALLATAFEDGLIRSNPAAGVRLPGTPRPEQEEERAKALTDEELSRLVAEVPKRWRLLVGLLGTTGLRISEALALRWRDLDLGRRRVLVRRSVNGGVFSPPKTPQSRRDVPISSGIAQALWRHRQAISPVSEDALVFSTRAGDPLDSRRLYGRVFKPAARRAGVPWAGWHALRHTCATSLFRSGMNAKQVQAWLGHHSAAFTLSVYVHLLPDDLPDAFEPTFLAALAGEQRGEHDAPKPAEIAKVPALTKTAV